MKSLPQKYACLLVVMFLMNCFSALTQKKMQKEVFNFGKVNQFLEFSEKNNNKERDSILKDSWYDDWSVGRRGGYLLLFERNYLLEAVVS